MLDEAAANNDKAGEYDSSFNFASQVEMKPKVMLKAGMGIADDPREWAITEEPVQSIPPVNKAQGNASDIIQQRSPVSSKPIQQQIGRGRMTSEKNTDASDSSDENDDDDDDDDDAWKNRRKALKNKAEERKPNDVSISSNVGVYGFGGAKTAPLKISKTAAAGAPRATKVQTTLVRASDRAIAASEEAKDIASPAHTVTAETALSPVSPGASSTWSDVPSPPNPNTSSTPIMKDLPPQPPVEVEIEPVAPILPLPPKSESSGLLSGSSTRSTRKPKGGKLLNVKVAAKGKE